MLLRQVAVQVQKGASLSSVGRHAWPTIRQSHVDAWSRPIRRPIVLSSSSTSPRPQLLQTVARVPSAFDVSRSAVECERSRRVRTIGCVAHIQLSQLSRIHPQRRHFSQRPPREDGVESPTSSDESSSSKTTLGQYDPQKLSEDILTVPNVLTIVRLLSTPLLGWFILQDEMRYALALLVASGFTDVLDGYLARRFQSATVFGSIADPAADKALMTVMVGALAWRGLIPLPLVILIVGRDVALVLSAFVIRWQSLPEPKSFSRYWDPRLPSARVEPTQVSKYNTFLQIVLVGICTLLASMNDSWRSWWSARDGLWNDESVAPKELIDMPKRNDWGNAAKKAWHAFMLVVATTTVWSGASYLFGTGAVRYVGKLARGRNVRSSPGSLRTKNDQ